MRDTNEAAHSAELPRKKSLPHDAVGRLGGLKRGRARAAALSPERRREIAQAAAPKRWAAKKGGTAAEQPVATDSPSPAPTTPDEPHSKPADRP